MNIKRICILFLFALSTAALANEVTILSPQDESVLTESSVPITINVTDPTKVDRVTYTLIKKDCSGVTVPDGCKIQSQIIIGTVTETPFNFDFVTTTTLNDANYNIRACVYFTTGDNQVCDTAANLTIQHDAPVVVLGRTLQFNLRRPLPDGTFPPEEPEPAPFPVFTNKIGLSASTYDDDGINSVKFYFADGALIGEGIFDTDPFNSNGKFGIYRYLFDTTNLKNGWYRIYVESTDNNGFTARHDPNIQTGRMSQGRYYIENHYTPTNLYARAKNYHLNVTWDGNEQDLAYAVYRKLDTETSFSYVGTTESRVWVDDLPIGTKFAEYYVRAVYEYGLSDRSETTLIRPAFRRTR